VVAAAAAGLPHITKDNSSEKERLNTRIVVVSLKILINSVAVS